MRVLMLLGHAAGGIGAHVDSLVRGLRDRGDTVEVVTSAATADRFAWPEAHRWWPVHSGPAALRGLVDWHRIMRLSGQVDVVHAHGHQAGVIAAVAAARANPRPRLIVSLHNDLPAGRGSRSGGVRAIRWALRRADLVTGASEDLVELARSLGARRVELATVASTRVADLLSLPVPSSGERAALRSLLLDRLGAPRPEPGPEPGRGAAPRDAGFAAIPPERPLVLTISRIAPQKDLPTLVRAVRTTERDATWVVVGGGDDTLRADLESQLSGIPLLLVGPQRDVTDWLRAADVFVLTSRWEARALVVQEAMAAGLPVVVTRTGGLPGLVGDAGVLVPVGDSAAVAGAVDDLLGDPDARRRRGAESRALAATWDTPEAEARRWHERYTAALSQ